MLQITSHKKKSMPKSQIPLPDLVNRFQVNEKNKRYYCSSRQFTSSRNNLDIRRPSQTSNLMFGFTPDLYQTLEPRLFSPAPEEHSYLESQILKHLARQEFPKPTTSAALQSAETTQTPKISKYISFPAYTQPTTMFSRLREIIWPLCPLRKTTSPASSTQIKTIYPASKGCYANANGSTTAYPVPPPFISRSEEDHKIMISTRSRLRGTWGPRLTISIPESESSIPYSESSNAMDRGVRLCLHNRRVRWADPLVSAVSAESLTRADSPTRAGDSKTLHRLKWGNPLITKISVEPPHAYPCLAIAPSAVPACFFSHGESSGLVEAVSGLVVKGGEGLEGDDEGDGETKSQVQDSKTAEPANIEDTVVAINEPINDTISSSIQHLDNEIETSNADVDFETQTQPTTMDHSTPWSNTPWTDEEFERHKRGEYGWIIGRDGPVSRQR